MIPAPEVADSTDWLGTPLSLLSSVESALRCQVCKDFYNTPMLTSCSHTFCSLCIRRALSGDNKCPLCRASDQEIRLRTNWSMEEAVQAFKQARTGALEFARNAGANKRKADDARAVEEATEPAPKRLRSSARLSQNRGKEPVTASPVEEVEEVEEEKDDDPDYNPNSACPMCQKKMKEWQVFTHLESCPGPSPQKKSTPAAPDPATTFTQLSLGQQQQSKSMERLPVLNYSMLKEQALRKKLAELGISTQGSRGMLERRHKEWITLWNANCDAARPKKRSALQHDLDVWERTQGARAPAVMAGVGGRGLQAAQAISSKEFDGSGWAQQHNDSFKDLIASARKSREAAKAKQEKEKESEGGKREGEDQEEGGGREIPETPEDVDSVDGREEQPEVNATRNSSNGQLLAEEEKPGRTGGSEAESHPPPVAINNVTYPGIGALSGGQSGPPELEQAEHY